MPNKQSKPKQPELKTPSDMTHVPVNSAVRIKQLFLDTQVGSPVDTLEEIDAQRNNLGPKDTKLELEGNEPENKKELPTQNRPR